MAKELFYLPPGIARYPHLTKPDDYKGALKYKVKVVLDPKDVAKVTAQLKALAKAGNPKLKSPNLPIKEDDEGNWVVNFSSKFLPTIYNGKGRTIVDRWEPPEPEELAKLYIGGGSLIRVAADPFHYDKGLSLQLESVKVIKLVKGKTGCAFEDDEEGEDWGSDDEADARPFAPRAADDEGSEGEGDEEIDL